MKRYRSPRRKTRRRIVFALVAFFFIAIIVWMHRNVTAILKSVSEATMRSITTVAVNDAIYYTLSDQVRYEDLVTVLSDAEGNISAITANSFQINRIARDTAYMSQQNLKKMSEDGIEIPLGAFTGVEAWAGLGPRIRLPIIPISNVECRFVSQFENAGINQTKHQMKLDVVIDIDVIMPWRTVSTQVVSEILIAETVIVGKVPQTYLDMEKT